MPQQMSLHEGSKTKPRFCFGEVEYKGRTAALSKTRFRLLQALVEAEPYPLSTVELYHVLHKGDHVDQNDKSLIRMHVAQMRRALEEQGMPIAIENRWGFGYRARLN